MEKKYTTKEELQILRDSMILYFNSIKSEGNEVVPMCIDNIKHVGEHKIRKLVYKKMCEPQEIKKYVPKNSKNKWKEEDYL